MGFPEEVIARIEAQPAEEKLFEVWVENWPVVAAFLAVASQWRMVGLMTGGTYWQGLDYAGVAAGLAGHAIAATPTIWAGLQVMEAAAREALNGVTTED